VRYKPDAEACPEQVEGPFLEGELVPGEDKEGLEVRTRFLY